MPFTIGAHYFFYYGYDFSRSTWIYLIKSKVDASHCLVVFCKMINTQFGKSVKRIRSENVGEFFSNQMVKFYEDNGTILETSCIHTPQKNGVVERKHRFLLVVARALRFEANLPIKF